MTDQRYPVFFDPSGVRKILLGLAFLTLGVVAALAISLVTVAIVKQAKLTVDVAPPKSDVENIARLTARDFGLNFENRSIANFIKTRLEGHREASTFQAPTAAAPPGADRSHLRLGFVDTLTAKARESLSKHVENLDVVFGDWLYVDGASAAITENDDVNIPDSNIDKVIASIRSKTNSTRIIAVVRASGAGVYRPFERSGFQIRLGEEFDRFGAAPSL